MAGLHFDITADNRVFVEALRKIQEDVKRTTAVIDEAGKEMDFGTIEQSIVSLSKVIEKNERKIDKYKDDVVRDMKIVQDALDNGDLDTANKHNGWIDESLQEIDELTKKTEEYREVLSTLSMFDTTGITSERVEAPMLFLNKEDYDYVKSLKDEIANLEVQIEKTAMKGEDVSFLKDELSEAKAELAGLEIEAMNNATEFGRTGRAVAELSKNIFELNDAVEAQIEENEKLMASYEEAERAYEQAKNSDNPEELERKRIARDMYAESVRNGAAQLNNLKSALADEKEKLEDSSSQWGKFASMLGNLPGPIGNVTRQITGLVGQAQQATAAIEGLTTATGGATAATLGFIALPILAFLAALAGGYAAVKTWMDRTMEGQDALNVATSRYNQVLENLKDRVSQVGAYIYEVFDDLTRKIEGMVGGLEKLLGVAGSFAGSSIGSLFGSAGSGIGAYIGSTLGKDSSRNIELAEQLAKKENQLKREKIKLIGEEADAQKKIRAYELEAYDMSVSREKRAEALKKAEEQINFIYGRRMVLAKQESEIKKERNRINDTNYDQATEEARLAAEVKRLDAEKDSRLKTMKRMAQRIQNQGKSEANQAAQQVKQQQEYQVMLEKQALDRERAVKDMELATAQAQVGAMKEGNAKTLKQIELDYKKQAEAIERGMVDIRRKKVEDARNAWMKNPSNKGQAFDASSVNTSLTKEEQAYHDALVKENETKRLKSIEDIKKAEVQAMNDYLKEYGSMSEKRLAIEREYQQKLEEAQTEGERRRLTKEMQAKKASLSFEEVANGIDWVSLFGGVENMTTEMMRSLFSQLKAFQQTEKYKDADAGTKQQIASMLDELRKYVGSTDQAQNLERMGQAVSEFNAAVIEFKAAQEDEKWALEQFEKAQEAEAKAKEKRAEAEKDLSSGKITQEVFNQIAPTADEIEKLGKETKASEQVLHSVSQVTLRAKNNVQNLGQAAKEAAEDVKKWQSKGVQDFRNSFLGKNNIMGIGNLGDAFGAFDEFKGLIDEGMGNGLISGKAMEGAAGVISDKIIPVIDGVGEGIMGTFSEGFLGAVTMYAQVARLILQMSDQVKNYVTGILDSFTELFKFEWLEDLVVSITESISNLVNAIFDLPENLYKALEGIVVNGVGDMLGNVLGRVGNVLSLGGLSTDWLTDSIFGSDSDFEAATKKWGWLLDSWQDNLEYEKSLIEKAYGKDVVDIAGKTVENLRETQKAARELYSAWAGAGGSATSHSHGYNANRDAVWQYLWDYNEGLGRKAGMEGRDWRGSFSELINNLTADELEQIKNENGQFWSTIDDTAKEYIQTIIDAEKAIPEVEEAAIKQLTDLDLSTLESQFTDMLNNWDKEAEDFSEDFEGYLKNAILKGLMVKTYSKQLEKWREDFSDAMDGGLDEDEMRGLREGLKDIFDRGRKEYEDLLEAAGITERHEDQQAKMNMADKATYDQFELYLGIATAQQMALEQGNGVREMILESMQNMQVATEARGQVVVEIRELLHTSNGYLLDIKKTNREMLDYAKEDLTKALLDIKDELS